MVRLDIERVMEMEGCALLLRAARITCNNAERRIGFWSICRSWAKGKVLAAAAAAEAATTTK